VISRFFIDRPIFRHGLVDRSSCWPAPVSVFTLPVAQYPQKGRSAHRSSDRPVPRRQCPHSARHGPQRPIEAQVAASRHDVHGVAEHQ